MIKISKMIVEIALNCVNFHVVGLFVGSIVSLRIGIIYSINIVYKDIRMSCFRLLGYINVLFSILLIRNIEIV